MSTFEDSAQILSSLLDAIKGDDIDSLESLLSTRPELLDLAAQIWPENPFFLAFNSKSLRVIKEIGRRKPGFASMKNQDGNTVLHLACASGDEQMVRVLVGIDTQLCFAKDNFCMIPLHTAIKYGRGDMVSELVTACPESLEKLTSHLETVFHVAVKNKKCDVFLGLFEEARKLEKDYLLNMKDDQQNNILHIAVSNELFPIVKMLLPYNPSSTTGFKKRVNSLNKRGHTALDLCNMKRPSDSAARIRAILSEAGALESCSLKSSESSSTSSRSGSMCLTEKRDVLLVILAIFIGVVFTLCSALPSYFPKGNINASEPFQFEAVAAGRLPTVFYFLVFLTATLTISTCFLTVLLFKLPLGYLLFLSGIAIFFLYILLADYVMPEFSIKLGSYDISSYRLMWILALSYIFAGTLVLLVGKCFLYKFGEWLKSKLQDANLPSTHNQPAEIEMRCTTPSAA